MRSLPLVLSVMAAVWLCVAAVSAETSPPTPKADVAPAPPKPEDSAPKPDASSGVEAELVSRPAATLEVTAPRDDIFAAVNVALSKINGEIEKKGLKPAARPLAVFLGSDDKTFKFRALVPVDAPANTTFGSDVKFGATPVGKAIRFEHRGAYDDIDGTYDGITALLDERGIDAQEVFVEEYINDVKSSEDPNLVVEIYVLLK